MIQPLVGKTFRRALSVVSGTAALLLMTWPSVLWGQAKPDQQPQPADHAKHAHTDDPATPTKDPLVEQLRQLQEKVAKLEAALSQGQKAGQSNPMGRGRGMSMGANAGSSGKDQSGRVSVQYQNCLQCHQTRPSGPLPPSHLEKAGGRDMGTMAGVGPAGGRMPAATSPTSNDPPGDPIQQIQTRLAKLEASLAQNQRGGLAAPGPGDPPPAMGMGMKRQGAKGGGMGMGMMGDMMGMGMKAPADPAMGGGMKDDDEMMGAGMKAPAGPAMGGGMGMKDDDEMMGMGAMGKAKKMGTGKMKMATTLPGFPGISHLYHIGAEGFFLNHDEHITLSANQRKKMNQIKEKATLGGTSCDRKVEEAEQELWQLTASDAPDGTAIEAKVREVEKLRGEQRLAFIRAVGEAAKVLTDDQRKTLAGTATEASAQPATTKP